MEPMLAVGTTFRLLGPLEVIHRGAVLTVPPGRQQALLVALLLRPNEIVPAQTLVEQVWGGDADRSVLNVCVMRLRRSLRDRDHDMVRAEGTGYRIVVDESAVDLHRFRRLCARAADARGQGDRERERAVLHEALALWRGEPFTGVVSPALQSEVGLILEEERLAAIERRVDADLECGAHAEVIRELRELVADNPFRERFWCQLLLALYRSGRQSEALDAFLTARRKLTEELGIEPGDELRELHHRILTSDPTLPARRTATEPEARLVPAQLPPTVAGFSGRRDQIRQLDSLLGRADPPPTTLITGPPGVGKTALAVHWASRHRQRWPDGQLYVDLRGYAPEAAVRPIEALAYFLRTIGLPADKVPSRLAEASALFRSLVADRRMLILLDNAAAAEQVRPLLPGGASCAVIVTSRNRLTGLMVKEGARQLPLDVMADGEARYLLADAVGAERLATEADTVGELVRLCGNLPLALRITAADLIGHPERSLAEHLTELGTGNRLDALQVAGDDRTAVRATFRSSYARLAPPVQRMFRLLGMFPGPEVCVESAAELAGTDIGESARLLDRLVSAHLIAPRGPDRFALHDLLRLFAAELAHEEDPDTVRDAAVQRLYDHYTRTVEAIMSRFNPQLVRLPLSDEAARVPVVFDDHGRALRWLETEWPNLVAAVRYAAEHGPRLDACRLAAALRGHLQTKVHIVDWLIVARAALAAAREIGDPRARAAAYLNLADLHRHTVEYPTSQRHYERALVYSRHEGWLDGQAAAHNNLGNIHHEGGRHRSATDHFLRALDLNRRIGQVAGEAVNLANLGRVRLQMGRTSLAVAYLRRSLSLHERIGTRGGWARSLASLAKALNALGEHEQARDAFVEAVDIERELDDRVGLPYSLAGLAAVQLDLGEIDQARELATTSVALAREMAAGESAEAQSMCVLAAIDRAAGRHDSALERYRRALDLTDVSGRVYQHVRALIGMGSTYRELGHLGQARHHLGRAVAMARRFGYRLLERQAATQAALAAPKDSR